MYAARERHSAGGARGPPSAGPRGLALGTLVDTFVVRTLMLPSTVRLLGHWTWWPSAPSGAEKPPRPAENPREPAPATRTGSLSGRHRVGSRVLRDAGTGRYPQRGDRGPRRPRQDHPGRRHALADRGLPGQRGGDRAGPRLGRPRAREGHHHPGQEHRGDLRRASRSTSSTPPATPTSAGRSSGDSPWSTASCSWSTPRRAPCPRPASSCARPSRPACRWCWS